jgi:hypothetical protein
MAYELRGQFLEACDCFVMCPCWFQEEPDEDECTGLIAWYVEVGQVDGVDVSGLTTVSVSHHGGHRNGGHMHVALYVDERADDEQQEALARAFTGEAGGPLSELAELTEAVDEVTPAKIAFSNSGGRVKLSVDRAVRTDMKPLVGSTNRVITVADSVLASVLGTPAEVGKSSQFKLDVGKDDFDRDLKGRSANRGRFSYLHKGRSRRRG